MTAVTRPVLRYHGGKWRLAPWIISHFPQHRIYVEPFGGGASVLMRKQRADFEVYNDVDVRPKELPGRGSRPLLMWAVADLDAWVERVSSPRSRSGMRKAS